MHTMKLTSKACLLGLLIPFLAQGQETGLLRMNRDEAVSGSEAAVWGGVEEGWFRPTYAGTFQWTAGAEAKTVRHGEKTSWTGGVSFQQMMGKNMGSSMLLNPGYFPVDIIDAAEGTKSRQTGKLEAGFLTDFGYELAAGLKASVQVENMAKRQGIKHSSFGLEAQLEPTVTYVMDDDMGLVSSYLVRVKTEQLKIAQQDGSAQPFVDMGMRIGAYESGLGQFPILEFAHGFNEILYNPELTVEFGIVWKRGRAGGTDYSRFRFPGSTLHAGFGQTLQADNADHVYHIAYRRERDQLRETGGEKGFTSLYGRKNRNLDLKYEVRFLHGSVKRLGVDLEGNQWDERGLMSSLSDAAKWYDGSAKLFSAFSFGQVDLDLHALAARGWWKDRGRIENVPVPGRLMNEWLRNMDYRTAPRVGVGGTVTVRIPAVQGMFVQLDGSWIHALSRVYVGGQNREIGTLKIGYKF